MPGSARGSVVRKGRPMTDLLMKAFDAASRLPAREQNAVAEWLLAEIASEEKWDARIAESQDTLTLLAQEALNEHWRGKTRDLDPESL